MTKTLRTFAALISLHSLSACQLSTKPDLESANPEVIIHYESFSLVFTEPMMHIDPREIKTHFEPEFTCHWVWSNDQKLDCLYAIDDDDEYESPIELKENTRYTIHFENTFRTINDEPYTLAPIVFQSSYPEIRNLRVIDRRQPLRPIIKIHFSSGTHFNEGDTDTFALFNERQNIPLRVLGNSEIKKRFADERHKPGDGWYLQPIDDLEYDQKLLLRVNQDIPARFGNTSMPKGTTEYDVQTFPETPRFLKQSCSPNHWKHNENYEPPCYLDDTFIIQTNTPVELKHNSYCDDTVFQVSSELYENAYGTYFSLMDHFRGEYINNADVVTRCMQKLHDTQGKSMDVLGQLNLSGEMGLRPKLSIHRGARQLIPQHRSVELAVNTTNIKQFSVHISRLNDKEHNQSLNVQVKDYDLTRQSKTWVDLSALGISDVDSVIGTVSIPGIDGDAISFEISRSPYIITLKHNPRFVALWLMDARSRLPVSDRDIIIHSPENTYSGTTDSTGFVQLEMNPDDFDYAEDLEMDLNLSIAEGQSAFYIEDLTEFATELPEQSYGNWWSALQEGETLIRGITDKPLYRPGETVKLKAYVRNKNDVRWLIPRQLPAIYAFVEGVNQDTWMDCDNYSSCQSFFKAYLPELNEWGGFEFTFKIPENAFNGEYRLTFDYLNPVERPVDLDSWLFRNDKYITSEVQFNVTDFVTSPYKVITHINDTHIKTQQPLTVSAQSLYHSGGPVINEQAEIVMSVEGHSITDDFPQLSAYDFPECDECYADQQFIKELAFDHQGKLVVDVIPDIQNVPYGTISINSGLKPEGSDWTYSQFIQLPYREQDHFLGLRLNQRAFRIDQPVQFDGMLVNFKGVAVKPDQFTFQLFKNDPKDREKWLFEKNLACNEWSHCEFNPGNTGAYKVKSTVIVGSETISHELVFYVFNPEYPDHTPNSQSTIITASKEHYDVGDIAEFEILFPDKQINTMIYVERNKILNQWHKKSDNGVVNVSFTVTESHVPGFTLATALIPSHPEQLYQIKQSVHHVMVDELKSTVGFSISTDDSTYNPGQKVQLDIESAFGAPAEFTVSVVDQSVLELIDFDLFYSLDQSLMRSSLTEWLMMEGHVIAPEDHRDDMYPETMFFYDDEWLIEPTGKIIVTGSRISRQDKTPFPPATDGVLSPQVTSVELNTDSPRLSVAGLSVGLDALRSVFKESVYFKSGIIIQPNGEQRIEIELPDNLTTWRILVLAAGQDGQLDFKTTDLQAQRQVEIINDLPVQLTEDDEFVGQSRVINKTHQKANIRLHSEVSDTHGVLVSAQDLFTQASPDQQYLQQYTTKVTGSEPLTVISAAKNR